MRSFTKRRFLGVLAIALVVVVVLVAWRSGSGGASFVDARDLVGGGAKVGETVATSGEVVSYTHRGLVLRSTSRDQVEIVVRTAEPIGPDYAEGTVVTVEGTLVEPGRIEDARVIDAEE